MLATFPGLSTRCTRVYKRVDTALVYAKVGVSFLVAVLLCAYGITVIPALYPQEVVDFSGPASHARFSDFVAIVGITAMFLCFMHV